MQFGAVFPGQGSQSIGMLADLADEFKIIKQTFQEGSDTLSIDLWKLTTESETELNKTENTQPVMLAAGVAVWRLWLEEAGCSPVGMAGHSLGEYSALVASEALAYNDALKLVSTRAKLMQQAVPEGTGAMAAILGLEDDTIINICNEISKDNAQIVEAVNFNSPGQVVIAGNVQAVDKAIEQLKEAGAKRAIKLPVSVPSHCSLMKEAAGQLNEVLNTTSFSTGKYPTLQNRAARNEASITEKKEALAEQLYKPVKWVDTINNLEKNYNADTIIEFGPGKILFGLNHRINRKLGNFSIYDTKSLYNALELCQQ